jgi:hypothetical protein
VTSPGYVQDNASSVRGRALRVTALGSDGAPAVGTSCDVYLSGGFISFQFTPAYSDGDEIEVKNAAGETCVYYKLPDTLKNVGLQLQLCDPDPVLTQMLVGGTVLTAPSNSAYAPAGTDTGDLVAVGYASEHTGHAATPNGVAVEVWADAIVNSRSASRAPFWHYLFPSAQFKLDGDRVIENGNLATQFAGTGVGNEMFGTGPNMDLTGVTPVPPEGAWDWSFPEYTASPFLYARTFSAPDRAEGPVQQPGRADRGDHRGRPRDVQPGQRHPPGQPGRAPGAGRPGQRRRPGPRGSTSSSGTAPTPTGTGTAGTRAPLRRRSSRHGRQRRVAGRLHALGRGGGGHLADLSDVTANPTTAWTAGQYVVLGNSTLAHWSGTAWVAGAA